MTHQNTSQVAKYCPMSLRLRGSSAREKEIEIGRLFDPRRNLQTGPAAGALPGDHHVHITMSHSVILTNSHPAPAWAIFAVPDRIRMPSSHLLYSYDFALVLPVHPHEKMDWYQPIRAMMLPA